ncbi:MAG: hypothetical protein GYB34_15465 [Gammaproteobacteria bacterium]|nr:hypothetical protein [Gammaproteobacteria bacterium]
MGVVSDVNEVKESFGRLSAIGKVIVVVSLFTTLSAVTTISETLIKWKGFVETALGFYQTFYVKPVITFGDIIGFSYSTTEVHALTLISFCSVLAFRLLVIGHSIAIKQINQKTGGNQKPIFKLNIISFLLPLAYWILVGCGDMEISLLNVALFALILPILLGGPKQVLSSVWPEKFGYFEKSHFNYFYAYYSILATLFVVVGILAGINLAFFPPNT